MTDKTLLVLNGPGLAELGDHDGNTYGNLTLDLIRDECTLLCEQLGVKLDFRQTDDEEEMFRFIAKDSEDFDALIINPVGYSRAASVEFEMYRMAIKTIAHLKKPVIEVHLENIFQEGAEITKPLQAPEGEMGFICGLGINSYLLAIKAVVRRLST
ncbi:MAG: type II 3-dehydroquinate dehydratase [Sedimenticola sp.]